MNCRDVVEILDNQRVDRLDVARRQQAQAHVAACADCARAWQLQASLATLPDMALPANFSARCRALVAAGSRPAIRRRVGSRILLGGAITALAAAAAMLVLLLRPTDPTSQRPTRIAEAVAPAVDAVSVERPSEYAAELLPAVAIETASAPLFTVRVLSPEAAVEAAAGEEWGPPPGVQRDLEALREEYRAFATEPATEQALRSLHVALIEELRKVPGLALVDSDPAEVTASSRNYQLRVTPGAELGPDGRIQRRDHRYSVTLTAEQLQSGGKRIHRLAIPSIFDPLAACSGTAQVVDAACTDTRATAAAMVRRLRQGVFPPEAEVTRPLQAKFRDSSLDPAERLKALAELFKLQTKTGDMSQLRDAGVVRAAIELAANTDPALRMQIWRSLRGVGNAALIQPLIDSLQQDPAEVQLAAIDTLVAGFRADPRVRSALEAAASGSSRPLVRAVAERGLSGEEGWRQYVVASLKDPNLPAAQRVEALAYYLYPPGPEAGSATDNPEHFQIMQELLDDGAVRALAEALPDAGPLREDNKGLRLISSFGYHYDKNPAVTEMLLRYLEHDTLARNRKVAGEVLARTHGSEPRVRDALTKAVNSDPDPGVRDWIRQIMGEKTR